MNNKPARLYVVVPCYNEEAVLPETAKRLEIMEQPDYEFPKRMGKGDFVIIAVAVAVTLVAAASVEEDKMITIISI